MKEASYLKASPADLQWWLDSKLGMFIHWGPAALAGQDISWCRRGDERKGDYQFVKEPGVPAAIYDKLYRNFAAERFDASEWVRIAKAAGMKYMVLTAKHHDGFCLFDSKYTDYKSTSPECPCGRDIVREFTDACHKEGMKVGIYYSARDWFHPDYLTENHSRYLAYYHSQLLELLCNYGRIDVLWFDHIGGEHSQWEPELVFKMARRLQPGILVNDRLHKSVHHGSLADYDGDFDTPEQKVGAFQLERPWESCLCLVGGVWSYKPDGEMMSAKDCVRSLVNCVCGGGNLLLNNGPLPDGRIEPRQADRLAELGSWLALNGESIYGTRGGPYATGEWGGSVQRGDNIYLHVLKEGELSLPPLPRQIRKAASLDGISLKFAQDANGVKIKIPDFQPDSFDSVVKLTTSA